MSDDSDCEYFSDDEDDYIIDYSDNNFILEDKLITLYWKISKYCEKEAIPMFNKRDGLSYWLKGILEK